MKLNSNYRKAFCFALSFHLLLIVLLLSDNTSKRPVLMADNKNTAGMQLPIATTPQTEAVKAVSVDSKEIMETVNRLKQEQIQKKQAEINHQKELNHQADLAKQQRIKEQQQLAQLKEEANRIAIERKKQVEEEKKHLKELEEKKIKEAKRIKELQEQKKQLVKQKEIEAKKLAELNKKKQVEKEKAEKLKAAKAKELAEQKRVAQAAAQQRSIENAQNQARLAGEVNKYKALIVDAIGRHWILPENVDSSLSSQFRIRLAPDGMVLEVTLTRSSGDPLLDRSAQTAIYKASPLPVPSDSETFNLFRDISLTVRPEQVRG